MEQSVGNFKKIIKMNICEICQELGKLEQDEK